jgi:hypothetical protein
VKWQIFPPLSFTKIYVCNFFLGHLCSSKAILESCEVALGVAGVGWNKVEGGRFIRFPRWGGHRFLYRDDNPWGGVVPRAVLVAAAGAPWSAKHLQLFRTVNYVISVHGHYTSALFTVKQHLALSYLHLHLVPSTGVRWPGLLGDLQVATPAAPTGTWLDTRCSGHVDQGGCGATRRRLGLQAGTRDCWRTHGHLVRNSAASI